MTTPQEPSPPPHERRSAPLHSDGDPAGPFRIHDLLRPDAFPHPVALLELRETLISWIILTGEFAYKIKKPVRLDYLDAATLSRREYLCREELRLNQRLAPEIYLDVVPIGRSATGLRVNAEGPPAEFAVRMREFAEDQLLHELLGASAVTAAELATLGRSLAAFHSQAALALLKPPDSYPDRIRRTVNRNLASLAFEEQPMARIRDALAEWMVAMLQNLAGEFRLRESERRIRECHGDLHARNVVRFAGRLTPFDCLEFDRELRETDVMNDTAFLVMDLVAHARRDLAVAFLDAYLEDGGDYRGLRLLRFYAVHRALVRAMVDLFGARQAGPQSEELRRRLEARLRTAMTFLQPVRPTLILMHGASGSGKSWLSERLAAALPAIRLRSDRERKRLPGLAAGQDLYAPAVSQRVYAHLADCARSCLEAGLHTIVDATFLSAEERRAFQRLGAELQVDFAILACTCDEALMYERVRTRLAQRRDPSDATPDVLARQLAHMAAFEDQERAHVIALDTSASDAPEAALALLTRRFPPGGPTAASGT